jgi:hypothetical protein
MYAVVSNDYEGLQIVEETPENAKKLAEGEWCSVWRAHLTKDQAEAWVKQEEFAQATALANYHAAQQKPSNSLTISSDQQEPEEF